MAFTLRIVFSGLCSFVPNRPFDPDPANPGAFQPPSRVDVVIPNVLESIGVANGKAILEPHYPILEFNSKDLASIDPGIFSFQVKKLNSARLTGVCLLFSEKVSIWPDGIEPTKDTLTVSNGVPANKEKPGPGEEGYLWWLAKLTKIMNRPMPTDPSLLDPVIFNHPVVAATMALREGNLRTFKLAPRKFQYRPIAKPTPSPVLTQKIAVKIAWEVPAKQEVQILFKQFGASVPRALVLRPRGLNKVVEVEVSNMEAIHIMGVKPHPSFSAFDPDFGIFYHLVTTPGPADEWRVPHIKGGVPAGGYGKPCSPAG